MNDNLEIKRPEETDYDKQMNYSFDIFIHDIRNAINNNVFSIPDKDIYNSFKNEVAVNITLKLFGWYIDRSWVGTKEEGQNVINIKALRK